MDDAEPFDVLFSRRQALAQTVNAGVRQWSCGLFRQCYRTPQPATSNAGRPVAALHRRRKRTSHSGAAQSWTGLCARRAQRPIQVLPQILDILDADAET